MVSASRPRPVRFIGPGDKQHWRTIEPEAHVVYRTREFPPDRAEMFDADAGPFMPRYIERTYVREWRVEPYGPLCTPVERLAGAADGCGGYYDVVFRFDSERRS